MSQNSFHESCWLIVLTSVCNCNFSFSNLLLKNICKLIVLPFVSLLWQSCSYIHCVRKRRGHSIPGITLTNLDSFGIFGTNHPDTSTIRKFTQTLQHCCMEMMSSEVIENAIYRQRRTFNKGFSKGKTWHYKSIAERICKQKLELLLIKSLLEKLINLVPFGSRRRRTSSCRHCSVQWRRTVVVSQHALSVALHIVNIDFELK